MTDRIFAETLVKAGLNIVDISLYSPHPEMHDQMRGTRGLWHKATKSIEIFAALQKQYRDFQVITQTLLCRKNYADFADLLRPGSRWITMTKYWLNKLHMGHLEQNIFPLIRRYRVSRGKASH